MVEANRSFKRAQRREDRPKIKTEAMAKLTPDRALASHQEFMDIGAKCTQCPLYLIKDLGPVPDEVRVNSRLTIIADAPDEAEIAAGRPACGKSAPYIFDPLMEFGIERSDTTLLQATLCRPPEDIRIYEHQLKIQFEIDLHAAKTRREDGEDVELPIKQISPAEACFPRFKHNLEKARSPFILSLGGSALRSTAIAYDVPFGGSKKVKPGELKIASLKKNLGSPITMADGTIVVPTYHPAFGRRKGSYHYKHVIRSHIERVAAIAQRGHIDWQEPEYILNPSVTDVETVLEKIYQSGNSTVVDIETDGGQRADGKFDTQTCRIRCIGLGAVLDGKEWIICVPLRRIDGSEWWSTNEEKKRVLQALVNVLNSNKLIGHNMAFDSSVMLRFGLMQSRGQVSFDTMLMARNTIDCDLPKDLGFVASRYFEVPSWKGAGDDKYYDGLTDEYLHLYNVRDCCTTLRLFDKLEGEIYRLGTINQYEQDERMSPAVRDMGHLGFFIDEKLRGEMCLKANGIVYDRLLAMKQIVGDPNFNPNSPPQVRQFLFGKKGLRAEINTKGKDWEEGEDASTNTKALAKLNLQPNCDAETKDFLDQMHEFRAYMKLKSTYIEGPYVTYPDWKNDFGFDVGRTEQVVGKAFRRYSKKERTLLGTEDNGTWDDEIILPERSALSRFYVTYKQHQISSGRLCASPNCQAIPERGKLNMRSMYVAPPGHVMVGADLDQVELRIYAAISGDKILLEAFAKGLDPHSYNAASLFMSKFSKEYHRNFTLMEAYEHICAMPDDQRKKLRGYAKVFAYLETYMGSAETLFAFMSTARDKTDGTLMFPGLTEADVLEWHTQWHRFHPETLEWQTACVNEGKQFGFTAAPIGAYRKRFFPGGANKLPAYANHPIQGSGAELVNEAYEEITRLIPYRGLSPVSGAWGQIHDYIGVYVPEDRGAWAKAIIEKAMNTSIFGVPITAKAKISLRWSEQ